MDFTKDISESLEFYASVSSRRIGPDSSIVPKQVKALLLTSPSDQVGVSLSWQLLDIEADYYEICRSGAFAQTPSLNPSLGIVDGDTLEIIVKGGAKQVITFRSTYITSGAASIAEVRNNINAQLKKATASLSYDTSSLIIRPDVKTGKGTKIEITGGSANDILEFPTGEFSVNPDSSECYTVNTEGGSISTYTDRDGDVTDSYSVRAFNALGTPGRGSLTKSLKFYSNNSFEKSIIWGILVDSGGSPLKGIEVILKPAQTIIPTLDTLSFNAAQSGVSRKEIRVFTDIDGYFELEAYSNSLLNLYIPEIKYDYVVRIVSGVTEFTKLPIAQENLNTNINRTFFF